MYYQADTISKAILSVILQCVIAHIYCKCFHCFFFFSFWIYRHIGLIGWNRSGCSEITTDIRDLRLEIQHCRLLCPHCSVFTLDLLFVSFDPKTLLQQKCCFRHGKPSKKRRRKHKTHKDLFHCNRCNSVTLWAPSMALCNWSVSSSGFNCELDFLYVSPNQFSY